MSFGGHSRPPEKSDRERRQTERLIRDADAEIRRAAMVAERISRWVQIYRDRERDPSHEREQRS